MKRKRPTPNAQRPTPNKKRRVLKSAKTGRFVSKRYAKKHKATTYEQQLGPYDVSLGKPR